MKLCILTIFIFVFVKAALAQVRLPQSKAVNRGKDSLNPEIGGESQNKFAYRNNLPVKAQSFGKRFSNLVFNNPNPLKTFHGNMRFTAQYSSQAYAYQPLPATFARWEFNPEFSLFGLPLNANIFWSTEQQQVSYQLNRFSLNFDSRKYQDQLAGKVKKQLESDIPDAVALKAQMQQKMLDKQQVSDQLEKSRAEYNFKGFEEYEKKYKADSFPTAERKAEFEKLSKAKSEYDSLNSLNNELKQWDEQYADLQERGYFDYTDRVKKPELKHPDRKNLSSSYALNRLQKLFLNIDQLEIGPINPYYSPLFINGVTMNGINVEAQPGKFYFAFIAGNVLQQLSFRSISSELAKSLLIGGRIGIGAKDQNHFYVSFFTAGNKSGLTQFDSTQFLRDIKKNKVLSFSSRINLDKNIFLEGEYATSLTQGMPEAAIQKESNPATILSSFNQANTAWSLNLKGSFPGNDTRFSALLQKTGAGFYTLGNPYLRRDLLRYNMKVEQKLYKQYLGISMNYKRDEDNLLPYKHYKSIVRSYSSAVSLYIKRLPSIKIIYTPFYQTNQAEETALKYKNHSRLLSSILTYSKKIGKKSNVSYSFNYTFQSVLTGAFTPVNFSYYTFSQLLNFKSKLISDFNASYIDPGYADSSKAIIINTGFNYKTGKKSFGCLGWNYTSDQRWGNSWGLSAKFTCTPWKNNQLGMMVKKNFPKGEEPYPPNAKQLILNFQLTQSW